MTEIELEHPCPNRTTKVGVYKPLHPADSVRQTDGYDMGTGSCCNVPGPDLKLIGVPVPRHPADWHRTMSTVSTEVTGNSFMQPAWICSAIREHSALPDL